MKLMHWQSSQNQPGSSESFSQKTCTLCLIEDIEDIDVANEDNSDAVYDKDMEVTDRNLKKENKKFGKELVARIAPE